MLRSFLLLACLLLWIAPRSAGAEVERTVASSRVLLGDLVPSAPPELADLDLGASPPAGSSRLYSIQDIAAATRSAGRPIVVKESIRAVRATRRWSQTELVAAVTPRLESALPGHARLLRVDLPKTLVTASSTELTQITFGQLPNRRGTTQTSAVAEFGTDGRVEHRLSFPVLVDLSERPKPVELERGSTVTLVVNLGTAKVSALALSLQSLAVGTTGLFRVVKTRKTLRAKLLTPSTAEVVSE